MMLIWLVRMSVTNDWKTYLHLNPYLLEDIHSVIVIQFDLRVMIEWRSNNQIYQDLNPCIFIKEHLKEMEEMIVNRIAQLLSIIETL